MPCYDCGRAYGDEHGFPDLVVPHAVWAKIGPTRDEGGLLCPSCMCHRADAAGVECVALFRSGPFASTGDAFDAMLAALRELVRINEEHDAAMAEIIGKPLGWKDDYLNAARDAIAKAEGR